MSKLVLVDLSGLFFSSWHATAGKDIDMAYRVTVDRVRKWCEGAAHVAICCDSGGKTFRHEIDPTYKQNRPERDQVALEQLRRVKEELGRDFHVIEAPGFEADDAIATLAAWAPPGGWGEDDYCEIVSGDKDLLALVGQGVSVRRPDGALWGTDEVVAKLGVQPHQVRDLLSLVGDSSDNVKGVKGIGAVNAAKLLAQFGDCANLLAMLDAQKPDGSYEVAPPSIRKALMEGMSDLENARKLVTLRTDAPIDCAAVFQPKVKPATHRTVKAEDYFEEEREEGTEEGGAGLQQAAPPHRPGPDHGGDGVLHGRQTHELQAPEPTGPTGSTGGSVHASHAIVPRSAQQLTPVTWSRALEPNSTKTAWDLAEVLFKSRLFVSFENEAAVLAAILKGRSMGLDALTSLSGINVIKGKPVLSSALMIGTVLNSGKAVYFDLVESTPEHATYETLRVGRTKPVSMTFTIEEARDAGYLRNGGQWQKGPKTMLRWRAGAELARAVYPDVVSNCYTPGELDE